MKLSLNELKVGDVIQGVSGGRFTIERIDPGMVHGAKVLIVRDEHGQKHDSDYSLNMSSNDVPRFDVIERATEPADRA